MTPGFKPFTILRSLERQSERLANNYISYASNVRRKRQQLWFNHRCKDLGLVPAGLRLKSPLTTQFALCKLDRIRVPGEITPETAGNTPLADQQIDLCLPTVESDF